LNNQSQHCYLPEGSKPKTKNTIIMVFIILPILLIACLGYISQSKTNECHKAAKEFISYVIEGSGNAQELSLGAVRHNLSKSAVPEFTVINIDTKVLNRSKDHAVVMVTSQSQKGDIFHLGWHKLFMIRTENQWKVYRIQEAEPVITAGRIEGVDDALAVLKKYVEALNEDYEQAAAYLAGRARSSHLYMEEVFKNQLTEMKFENITAAPVSGGRNTLLLQVNYQMDNRNLSSLVSFYRSSKGWMIYDISQI